MKKGDVDMEKRQVRALALTLIAGALVLGGRAAAQVCPNGCTFDPVVPCRIVDTRDSAIPNPNGPPALTNGVDRSFQIKGFSRCGIPATANAISVTLTAVSPAGAGWVSLWPTGSAWPGVSNLNFSGGESAVANGAVVMLGSGTPDLSCRAMTSAPMHVIIDVVGYYRP